MKSILKLYPWRTILALFLTLMTAFLLPGTREDQRTIDYGYPFHFLSIHPSADLEPNEILIFRAGFNIAIYFLDFYIVAVVINIIVFIRKKIKDRKRSSSYPSNNYPAPPPSPPYTSPPPPNSTSR